MQTKPIHDFEVGTNTNLACSKLSQTQPMQHFEAGKNTNLVYNKYSKIQPRIVNTQLKTYSKSKQDKQSQWKVAM